MNNNNNNIIPNTNTCQVQNENNSQKTYSEQLAIAGYTHGVKPTYGIYCPAFVFSELKLNGTEALIYSYFYAATQANKEPNTAIWARASFSFLASFLNVSERSIVNTINKLCKKNLLAKKCFRETTRGDICNLYAAILPNGILANNNIGGIDPQQMNIPITYFKAHEVGTFFDDFSDIAKENERSPQTEQTNTQAIKTTSKQQNPSSDPYEKFSHGVKQAKQQNPSSDPYEKFSPHKINNNIYNNNINNNIIYNKRSNNNPTNTSNNIDSCQQRASKKQNFADGRKNSEKTPVQNANQEHKTAACNQKTPVQSDNELILAAELSKREQRCFELMIKVAINKNLLTTDDNINNTKEIFQNLLTKKDYQAWEILNAWICAQQRYKREREAKFMPQLAKWLTSEECIKFLEKDRRNWRYRTSEERYNTFLETVAPYLSKEQQQSLRKQINASKKKESVNPQEVAQNVYEELQTKAQTQELNVFEQIFLNNMSTATATKTESVA